MIEKRQMAPLFDYVCREAENPTPAARPACAYPWNAGWPEEGNASPQPAEHHKKTSSPAEGASVPLFGRGREFFAWESISACTGGIPCSMRAKGREGNPVTLTSYFIARKGDTTTLGTL